jgi:hypothetical protein
VIDLVDDVLVEVVDVRSGQARCTTGEFGNVPEKWAYWSGKLS